DKGIVLWTLRFGDEVRDAEAYFGKLAPDKPEPKLLRLVEKLIEERRAAWDPAMVADPVQAKLLDIIATKKKGRKRTPKTPAKSPPPPDNVIDIMAALKNSIAAESRRRR